MMMLKTTMTLLLACLVMVTSLACSNENTEAIEPVNKFISIMEKHTAKIKDGSYESDAFLDEIQPVAEEIRTLRLKEDNRSWPSKKIS